MHVRFESRDLRGDAGERPLDDVGLGGVHPPRVHALREQRLVDLRPVELSGLVVEGVVEGEGVADEVLLSLGDVELV
jgi:hypothetical protein